MTVLVCLVAGIALVAAGCGTEPTVITKSTEEFEPIVDSTTALPVDLNDDGETDWISLKDGTITLTFILTRQKTSRWDNFSQEIAFAGIQANVVTVGDVDDDGVVDIVYGDKSSHGAARVMYGKGDGRFERPDNICYEQSKAGNISIAGNIYLSGQVVVTDANLDGENDLVILYPDGTNKVWIKDKDSIWGYYK